MTGIQPIILRRRRLILFKLKQCGIIGSTSGCINGDGVDRVVKIVLNVKRREREREREIVKRPALAIRYTRCYVDL